MPNKIITNKAFYDAGTTTIVPKSSSNLGHWKFCKLLDTLMTVLPKTVVKTFNMMTILVKIVVDRMSLKTILENYCDIESKN